MAKPVSRATAEVNDWPGLMSSLGSQAKNPGAAAEQVNLAANVMGELRVRPGIREVQFDNEGD